jgi:hypothetical protein
LKRGGFTNGKATDIRFTLGDPGMNLPRLHLSTLGLLVVIAVLSTGIVTLMKRHHDEVTQLRAELAATNAHSFRVVHSVRITLPHTASLSGTR